MITRDEIRSIPDLHKSILRDKEQLHFLHEKATSVPSGLSEGERVQTSPDNKAGKYIDAAADLHREILEKEADLMRLQSDAEEFIETVDDSLAKKVLRYRYLKCMKWSDIAELLGYVEGYLREIEREAVKELLPPAPTYVI